MRKEKIVIEVEYGSLWQAESQGKSLEIMLSVWKQLMESKHKNNKATITYPDL